VGRTGQAGTGGCDPVSGGLAAGHTVPLGADAAGAPAGASREPRYGTGPPGHRGVRCHYRAGGRAVV